MKITIDTKEESVEDLRKLISYLKSICGEEGTYNTSSDSFGQSNARDIPEDSAPAFVGLFGDSPINSENDDNEENLSEKENKDDSDYGVETY